MTLSCSSAPSLPASAPHAQLGQRIAFAAVTNDGQPVELPPAGRKTLLDYWAPSCKPCREKLPKLLARRAELRAAGTEIVLVGVLSEDESTALAEQTLREWGAPGERFAIDRGSVAQREAGVTELPTTQLYDAQGTLRWVAPTTATDSDVVAAARALK